MNLNLISGNLHTEGKCMPGCELTFWQSIPVNRNVSLVVPLQPYKSTPSNDVDHNSEKTQVAYPESL